MRIAASALLLLLAPAAPARDALGANGGQETREEAIVWSATRRLTWNDFKGKPVRQLDGARSALSHNISAGCRDQQLLVSVQTVFLPGQSWVTYRIISSGLASRVGLDHEQIHFDLAEVVARQIRRMYAELTIPCPRSDEALQALADPLLREGQLRQRRFDEDTQYGELEATQIEWAKRIARELVQLEAFGDSRPKGGLSVPSLRQPRRLR